MPHGIKQYESCVKLERVIILNSYSTPSKNQTELRHLKHNSDDRHVLTVIGKQIGRQSHALRLKGLCKIRVN